MNNFNRANRTAHLLFHLIILIILLAGMAACKKGDPVIKPVKEKKWKVSTIAGDGTAAFGNGPALSAKFNSPTDVAVAADGTVYVTDTYNHVIRKISGPNVSTFAGSDSGYRNGVGAAAQFLLPYVIAIDANQDLYVSDVNERRLRKISPAAEVTTFAEPAAIHFFFAEGGIAPDAQGNVFIADTYNQRIREISAAGQFIEFAGNDTAAFRNGRGDAAWFNYPIGLAADNQGNIFVADIINSRIRKINPEGVVSSYAGTGEFGDLDGDVNTAQFSYPRDVAVDHDGNVYVLDLNRVRQVTPQGVVTTIAGSDEGYNDGDGTTAKFAKPRGIGIDAQGNIYVADSFNNRIRKISYE